MKLPDKRTKANANPLAYSVYLYGEPKTGKTTWAAQADALILATEPGTKALDTYEIVCPDWQTLQDALAELEKNCPDRYKAIAVDTIDLAYSYCSQDYCDRHKISHPSKHEYGRGWGLIKDDFAAWLGRLLALPKPIILIGHAKYRDATSSTPAKYIPVLSGGPRDAINKLIDITLFAVQSTKGPVLHAQGGSSWDAGSRVAGMPPKMPMDYHAYIDALTAAVKQQKGKAKAAPANTESSMEIEDDAEEDDDPFVV